MCVNDGLLGTTSACVAYMFFRVHFEYSYGPKLELAERRSCIAVYLRLQGSI
jgi:hypothetical protein